ncbi:probable tRNA (uracil-O(2)-)-methyltransferase, partial [Schistocerca gregaria]|uniref:probable tRNA (uracil-O(2)-)-methyltransferase n=1 Tax=Schistocerca gregaria TaxID=7010 RepID=UPI00211EFCCC
FERTHQPESTDASKYVHEDLGIASFIISLWSNPFDGEYSSTEYKPSFVDLGCGNGFLVNILANEGYTGYGIDLAKRKIWENYSPEVTLLQKSLDPLNDSFEQDWIIANHPDELTPWIPMIASRKNNKFFILPCCEYDFSSKYSAKGNIPKYASYLLYIKKIATICGYDVEVEHLRIPSTRNIAIIGRRRSVDISDSSVVESIEIAQRQCLADANFTKFVPREKKSRKHK